MFTLPDVEVTIQKHLKFNRLRVSCHSYSFKGVHDLFNQKLGFFTTNFRARSFCPSFIYLLTTAKNYLKSFPIKLCPSLNRATDDARRRYLRTPGKSPSYALVIPYIHYLIAINFLREIDFEKLSLAASNFLYKKSKMSLKRKVYGSKTRVSLR